MKTIYVIDNGEEYSDHIIYFVETNQPREVMEIIQELSVPDGNIVGCGVFSWWEGDTITPEELLNRYIRTWGRKPKDIRALIAKLPNELQTLPCVQNTLARIR